MSGRVHQAVVPRLQLAHGSVSESKTVLFWQRSTMVSAMVMAATKKAVTITINASGKLLLVGGNVLNPAILAYNSDRLNVLHQAMAWTLLLLNLGALDLVHQGSKPVILLRVRTNELNFRHMFRSLRAEKQLQQERGDANANKTESSSIRQIADTLQGPTPHK